MYFQRTDSHCGLWFVFALLVGLSVAASAEEKIQQRQTIMDLPQPALCFAEGTPAGVIDRAYARSREWHEMMSLSLPGTAKHEIATRWTRTATDGYGISQGDPITITWSVVPDGTNIPGAGSAGDATAPSNLRAFLTGIYGSEGAWLAVLQQVFDRWGALTGITYVYEPNDNGGAWTSASGSIGVRGDVRISGHRIDGNYGILAYNYYPSTGDMVIDTDDSFYSNTSNNSLGLRNVLAHEHGHGLGLAHSCPINSSKLMEPFVTSAFDGPQHDDILAANRSYGDRFEHNDNPGTASSLGAVVATTESNLSVDSNTDVDLLSFSVDSTVDVNLTVTPSGLTYLAGPQNGDGSCSAGSDYNSDEIQDLAVRLLDTNGSSVLRSVDDNGVGQPEAISGYFLPGAGTYFIEVSGDASDEAQLYQLGLVVASADLVFIDGFETTDTTEWSTTVP